MEAFNKTIKKLSDEDYTSLLEEVAERKNSKPYMVMEAARLHNYDDSKMMDMLQVNSNAYYTLKSRLKTKIAAALSRKVSNPISTIMAEVARVPAMLYGTNKGVATRALKELEKQLLEYDLSNELIVVYRTLARLNLHNYDNEYYGKLYNKYVAYSLAVSKAENLYYDFTRRAGQYLLTRSESDFESMISLRREMINIKELYDSHRLFVLHTITNLYFQCLFSDNVEQLKLKEIEFDNQLKEVAAIINKYDLDTFYQYNKYMVDMLYFEFYLRTGNAVRADQYFRLVMDQINEISDKHAYHFHILTFLFSTIALSNLTRDKKYRQEAFEQCASELDIDKEEMYNHVYFRYYLALVRFYDEEYSKSAKIINDLRNDVSLRGNQFSDIQLKVFQCLQYALQGEEELSMQQMNSTKRQISESKEEYDFTKSILKLLSAAIKPDEYKKKLSKLSQLYLKHQEENIGYAGMLNDVVLEEKFLKRLADPYKLK